MTKKDRPEENEATTNGPGAENPTSEPAQMSLAPVVEALCSEAHALVNRRARPGLRHEFPSRATLIQTVEDLRSVLFPGYFGPSEVTGESVRYYIGATLDRVLHTVSEQVKRGLCAECEETDPHKCAQCDKEAFGIAQRFIATLPQVRRMLATDVLAAYEGDPAATSPDEAIYSYPGMLAITEHAHSITGIDIHPGATIGERFFIDHGTGVVIGETSLIGKNVRIYQGVTLGAKSFPLDEHGNPIKGIPRHPIVEDDVIIYSNATVLGRVTIGKGSVIGGNVWLTCNVPPGSSISQAQIKDRGASDPTSCPVRSP